MRRILTGAIGLALAVGLVVAAYDYDLAPDPGLSDATRRNLNRLINGRRL